MKQTLMFIQIAETSYDESLFIGRMLSQLSGEYQVVCLVNGMSSSLVSSHPGAIVGVLTENQDDNLGRFEALIAQAPPQAIILLDLYKFFLNPMELNFLPAWLEGRSMPILALDYYNLLVNGPEGMRLHPRVQLPHLEAGEGAEALDLKAYLLKPVPPVQPEGAQPRTFYWNPLDTSLAAAAPQLRQQVLDSLGAPPETRLVTLLYDPTLFSQALERHMLGYYFVLVEVMIYYLRKFKGQRFQLLVIGSAPPTDQVHSSDEDNFEVHYFSHLTEDNYRALLAASDLLISNTNWSPALLDAASLGLPAAVMGNSIIQDWRDASESQKELKSYFSPCEPIYNLCQLMLRLNQWSVSLPVFQFINYPHRYEDPDFPATGLQEAALPYFLFDMFDDIETLKSLRELLFSPKHQDIYRIFTRNLLNISEQGQSFAHIIERIKTS